MKKVLLIFTLSCIAIVSSYGQEIDIQSMLQDQQNRDKVYQTIMEDQTYMKEFMQQMRQNKQAMQMMNKKQDKKSMMQGQQMQGMMQDSTSMNQMMQNPEMMQQMMRMMHQKGMMSDDCMKAGMKKMKKMKKMKGNDMKMKNQNKDTGMKKGSDDDDHSSHH